MGEEALEECYYRKTEASKRQRLSSNYYEDDEQPTYDEYVQFKDGESKQPIVYPMPIDVLFCKGNNVKNARHYGNIEFTDLMKREAIRQDIIDEVKSRGGRFLTLDEKFPGGHRWFEIESGIKLHDRVAASLYDHKCRSTLQVQ